MSLPAERHVCLDRLLSFVQIRTSIQHVKSNGVDLVALRLGEAITSHITRLGGTVDTQQSLRDHPDIARTLGQSHDFFFGVIAFGDVLGFVLVVRPGDHDVRVRLDFKQRHVCLLDYRYVELG